MDIRYVSINTWTVYTDSNTEITVKETKIVIRLCSIDLSNLNKGNIVLTGAV